MASSRECARKNVIGKCKPKEYESELFNVRFFAPVVREDFEHVGGLSKDDSDALKFRIHPRMPVAKEFVHDPDKGCLLGELHKR